VIASVVFSLLTLSMLYGIVVLGLVLLLRKIGLSAKRAIIAGFLVFGAVTGTVAARAWPVDSSVYFNVFASLLGDQLYSLSIRYLGDARSAQAHYTIPWVLRVPQVYAVTSAVLCGLVGLLLQVVYNRRGGRLDLLVLL